jgi:hypothetical protein
MVFSALHRRCFLCCKYGSKKTNGKIIQKFFDLLSKTEFVEQRLLHEIRQVDFGHRYCLNGERRLPSNKTVKNAITLSEIEYYHHGK